MFRSSSDSEFLMKLNNTKKNTFLLYRDLF